RLPRARDLRHQRNRLGHRPRRSAVAPVPRRTGAAEPAAGGRGRAGRRRPLRPASGAEGAAAVTRFWLVRHGPTHARGMVGWTDLPADLSDGTALARLSAHLPGEAPVISSDLSRAVATADALAACAGRSGRRRLPHDPGLR